LRQNGKFGQFQQAGTGKKEKEKKAVALHWLSRRRVGKRKKRVPTSISVGLVRNKLTWGYIRDAK